MYRLPRSQTTSSSDGTIRVWDVSNPNEQEPTCIKVLDGLIAAEEPESEMQCEAVWHPSGRYFVVGTKSHGEWRSCRLTHCALSLTLSTPRG